MIKVGIAGIGFMGWIHYLAYQKIPGLKFAAFCSRDAKKRAGDWRGIQGNFGPPGDMIDVSGLSVYKTLEEMLADPSLDLIDLCLPPDLHATATRKAFAAGKHVLCEKPIALSTADADKMVSAAAKAKKLLAIGHVLPFFPEYQFVLQTVRGGKYGKFLGGHFKRTISDPLWLKDFFDPKKVGGPVVDLHVHDAHFIRLLCGMPRSVSSVGRMRGKTVEYLNTQFRCKDKKLVVSAESGVINQQGRAFTHGFEIHLEKATLLYDFSMIDGKPVLSMPLTLIPNKGTSTQPQLGSGNPTEAFVGELTEVANSLRSGKPSNLLSGDLARDALVMCQKQIESVKKGKAVEID